MALASTVAFQSTPPTQGSDACQPYRRVQPRRFNPRPPRRGATPFQRNADDDKSVSIHAPHAGERHGILPRRYATISFQSTPPTQGSDMMALPPLTFWAFQSTPPTQGSDGCLPNNICTSRGFNPRPPRRGATWWLCHRGRLTRFQSTPPTQGSDPGRNRAAGDVGSFNPRPPRRGATYLYRQKDSGTYVSIHAPHAGERHAACCGH